MSCHPVGMKTNAQKRNDLTADRVQFLFDALPRSPSTTGSTCFDRSPINHLRSRRGLLRAEFCFGMSRDIHRLYVIADPEFVWQSIGIPSAPPLLPVTVLVGCDNGAATSFVIDHWEPAPTADQLAALLNSLVRQKLADQLASHIAVLIDAPQESKMNASVCQ